MFGSIRMVRSGECGKQTFFELKKRRYRAGKVVVIESIEPRKRRSEFCFSLRRCFFFPFFLPNQKLQGRTCPFNTVRVHVECTMIPLVSKQVLINGPRFVISHDPLSLSIETGVREGVPTMSTPTTDSFHFMVRVQISRSFTLKYSSKTIYLLFPLPGENGTQSPT